MSRYAAYIASIVLTVFFVFIAFLDPDWTWVAVVSGMLALLGTWDVLQHRSTLRRNYPILAYFRYGLESIGPEMRQYFIESDTAEVPFSRQQRALVYQRLSGGRGAMLCRRNGRPSGQAGHALRYVQVHTTLDQLAWQGSGVAVDGSGNR